MTRTDREQGLRGGHHLRVLRVDLSTGSVESVPISAEFAREHIGGPGFGAGLIAECTRERAAALSPGNALVFAPGPLTGLALPGAARCHIMALSPESGRIGGGSMGGALGPAVRRAGYDAVVIVGRSAVPCSLNVSGSQVRIRPASHLAGLGAGAASGRLRAERGRAQIGVAAIGPAGEGQDPKALISSGGHHCADGMGAVMGAKNLKAIAVSGDRALPVAEPERLAALAKRLPVEGGCAPDCAAGCAFRRGGPAPVADELGVDVGPAAPHKPRTPEMMLLDLFGLCYQPWLEIEGGIELAVECYRAVTGVERLPGRTEQLRLAARVKGKHLFSG